MILFCSNVDCPACDLVVEPRRAVFPGQVIECRECGSVLEPCEAGDRFEVTPEGVAVPMGQEAPGGHPAVARRLTADFDALFPAEG